MNACIFIRITLSKDWTGYSNHAKANDDMEIKNGSTTTNIKLFKSLVLIVMTYHTQTRRAHTTRSCNDGPKPYKTLHFLYSFLFVAVFTDVNCLGI